MKGGPKQALVVDDSPMLHRLIEHALEADDFAIVDATTAEQTIRLARSHRPDVIVLDADLPSLAAFDVCMQLKCDDDTRFIPVFLAMTNSTVDQRVLALNLGASEIIAKPIEPIEFRARVRAACRLRRFIEMLENQTRIDSLTSLENRASLDARLAEEWERSRRYQVPLAVLMIDVDHFKSVNDRFGHTFGDVVLIEVAELLRRLMRKIDLVARYGGEEFAVILPEQPLVGAGRVAERIRSGIAAMDLQHEHHHVPITVSIGLACTDVGHWEHPSDMVSTADRCLYAAKQAGRNRVFFWDGTSAKPYEAR